MKLRKMMTVAALAGACVAALAAAPQSDKQPITPNTGRIGDPTSVARKYQDYLYGVIKEKNPDALILSSAVPMLPRRRHPRGSPPPGGRHNSFHQDKLGFPQS